LSEIDEEVKKNLHASAKDQDERLKAKLEKRRKKKEEHLKKENVVKKDHMHERI